MSGSLRRLLGLALTRQQRRIRDAQTFLGNNGDYTTARANVGIALVGKLKVSYDEYEKIEEDWQTLIESLTDATEKAAEEARYQEHAFDDKTKTPFRELMADLLEAIGDLESEISIIDRTIAAQNAATQAAAVTAAQVAAAAAQPAVPAAPATITVPSQMVLLNNPGQETKKRLFNGDSAAYKGFVDDWDNSVGNKSDITDVLKLQMLKQRVEGEAYSAICRYSTAAEYPEALAKLKQRFGRERDAIAIHLKKLAIPVHDKNDLSAVRRAFDDFEFHLVALNGYAQDIEAAHFKELLKSKLPEEVLNQLSMYERTLTIGDATVTEYRKQADLIIADVTTTYGRFLPRVVKTNVKQIISPKPAFVPYDGQKSQRPQVVKQEWKKVSSFILKCPFCEGNHKSDDCPSCTTLHEAQQIAKDKNLCFKCFRSNHPSEKCKLFVKCNKCLQRHHTLHCKVNESKRPVSKKPGERVVVAANKVVAQKGEAEVLLLSREVTVSHPDNPKKCQKVLVFVDSGAQLSLIDKDLTKALQLPVQKYSTDCQGPTGEIFVADGKFDFNIHLHDGSKYLMKACGSSNMISKLTIPSTPVEQLWDKGKQMKQPLPIKHGYPKILLSMKEFGDLVAHQPSKKLKNGFFWINSKLGPLIGGKGSVVRSYLKPKSTIVATIGTQALGKKVATPAKEEKFAAEVDETLEKSGLLHAKENVNLGNVKVLLAITKKSVNAKCKDAEKDCEKPNPVVARVTAEELTSDPKFLYELELMGIVDDPNADEYRLFMQRFLESVEQHPDGRIYVELPFHDLTNLGTNYNNCFRRLNSQVKRFLRDPEYATLYKKAVDEFVENKFTEVVSTEVLNDADTHFMPHSLVIKPGKTTSARLVIDGSCKTEKGESLNDKLLIGDNRLPDLAGVLLRSRFYPIIVASDIKKAFLQIHLKPDSQKYVRFLFVKDLEKPLTRENLVVYQFLVNPFGLGSSPNILAHATEYHLKKFAQECPEFAPYLLQVLRNNYVDNLVLGSKLVEEAITANEIVKQAFAAAKMDLRGHVSNSPEVNKHFGVDAKSFNLLGHELVIPTDELTFGWKKLDPLKPPKTKKELVSFSASLFDLLGILEPLRVPIKLLIRKAWDHKSDWKSLMDKALIEDVRVLYEERLDFCIRLKRKVFQNGDPKIVQLLVFADASEKAYGVAVYLRYLDKNGKFYTTLIFAKSRIAALKIIMTITKLELTATALALHVVEFIKAQLKDVVIIEKVIIFTDSSTVLYWIKNPEGKGRYVINRVNKLRESDAEFRHVPGTLNPADLVSRGCSPSELINNRLWFEGPEFLRKAEEFWPAQPNLEKVAEQLEPLIVAAFKRQDSEKIIIEGKAAIVDATKFRNWQSLVGTYVVILKFLLKKSKSFCKKFFEVDQPDEIQILKQAEIVLIKNIQSSVPLTAQKFLTLDLYFSKGLITKYCKVKLEEDPIYLADCPETRLLILEIHGNMNHGSDSMVLSQLNQRFYLPKARSIVKSTLRNRCMGCRKAKAVPFALPLMHDLPLHRSFGKPFEAVGIDLAGPVSVKLEGVTQPKSHWIVLFACLSTRAIHLELVPSLSGESFIEALSRMTSRRGMPSFIFSDNATNLTVTAATVIPKWIINEDADVMNYCTSKKIRWKFTTAKAPWSGGVYEAMIKLLKVNLKRAIGKKCFTLWKLLTLLTQVEAWVNCRPLTYISEDANQIVVRPIDFLSPFVKPGLPSVELDANDDTYSFGSNHENLVALWTKAQEYLKKFKDGFNNDYLRMLRDRTRHHQQSGHVVYRTPRVDEVVLLFEDRVDREVWKLAKVVEVLEGSDGRFRTAKIQTPSGKILKRPVNHLLPLEVDDASMVKPTQPIKAANLPQLHLGDPLAHDHTESPEISAEPASVEVAPPAKTHQMQTRRDPRRVMSILQVNPAFVLICCLFAFFSSVLSERCPSQGDIEKVYQSPCYHKEFSVYRFGSGFCWQEYYCSTVKSVSPARSDIKCETDESCNCPRWAHGCSSTYFRKANVENSATKIAKAKQALRSQKPVFCSYNDDPHCSQFAQVKQLMQIQLLDDSLHFVNDVHIVHQQVHNESFKCFGDGSDGYDGPEEFCKGSGNTCYEDATSVCVPKFFEKHFLQTSSGNVEIKAWGLIDQKVYHHLTAPFLGLKTKCVKAFVVIQINFLQRVEFVKVESKIVHISVPKFLIGIDQNITITLWRKGVAETAVTQLCNRTDICEVLSFGPEFVANDCCTWWVYAILIFFLIILPLIIIELFYLVRRQKRGPRARLLKLLFDKIRKIKHFTSADVAKSDVQEGIELVNLANTPAQRSSPVVSVSSQRASPQAAIFRYKAATLAVSLALSLSFISSVDGAHQIISFQAKNDYCIRNAAGIKSCQHNSIAHFTIMDTNSVEMLFQDDENLAQASLSVTVTPTAICQKGYAKFSRLIDVKVYSSKRCPSSGSCINDVCAKTSSNTTINELTLVNNFPGVTRCSSSCGCWGCGCFLCYDSCTFFRYYAQPLDETIYEEFSCRKWVMGANIQTTFLSQNKNKTENFFLEEGMVHELKHFKLSLPSVRTSDVISFKNFIFDGKRIAFADETSSKAMKILSCNSRYSAAQFHCKLSEDTCSCLSAGDGVNCQCSQNHILKAQLDGSFFPSTKAHIQFCLFLCFCLFL
uniref:Integrase catalytic domain-containing protein n=1 Tax=Panagrolaimus sp. PS1159 TaxID=55785 RepID=A0AC35F5M7_9BILA